MPQSKEILFLKAVENLFFFEHSFIIGKKKQRSTLPTQMLTILEYNRIKN